MIPYFQLTSFSLGPVTIHVWGLMVALGIVAATLLMTRLARRYLLSPQVSLDLVIWALVGGFLGARFFHVVFYSPSYYLAHPVDVLKVWQGGMSSLGGFFGAAVAAWLFSKVRRFSFKEMVPYLDIATVSLWLGWGIGRIGCFLIHDHPGTLSNSPLAVQFPSYQNVTCLSLDCPAPGFWGKDIAPRHDLGLYESILGFVLFIVFIPLFKKLVKKGWGIVTMVSWMFYAAVRFFLDFLRATDLSFSDVRYAYLTPAQWGMLVLFFTLTFLFLSGIVRRQKNGEFA